jgi:hypothetical protein
LPPNIGLHDLEAVQWPAEAGLRVGDDGSEPVALGSALGMLDLVGALERAIDPPTQLRPSIGWIERLVRVHGARSVGVGRHLPATEVDRLQAGAHHLHRLIAGQRAQRVDVGLGLQELPQSVRPPPRQRVFDGNGAAQPLYILGRIRALDAVEAAGGGGDQVGETGHGAAKG